MLIQESQLKNHLILEDNISNLSLIPVINSNSGNIVRYNDISDMQNTYNVSFEEALNSICNENSVGFNDIIIGINESNILLDPSVLNDIKPYNFVVDPIFVNESTEVVVNYLTRSFLETGDNYYLDVLEESTSEVINEIFDNLTKEEKAQLRQQLADHRKSFHDRYKIGKIPQKENYKNAQMYYRGRTNDKRKWSRVKRRDIITQFADINNYRKQHGQTNNPNSGQPGPQPQNPMNTANKASAKGATSDAMRGLALTGALTGAGFGAYKLLKNRKQQLMKVKALRQQQKQLEAQLASAPPEKKGFFRRLIDRIKNIISTILNKIKS